MRFLQVHLSLPKGGAHIAVQNIKVGLERIGHRCNIEMSDPHTKILGGGYDLVLLHSFQEKTRHSYIKCLEILQDYSIPHVVVMHDFWSFCHQTNLVMPKMGWRRCIVDDDNPCDPENRCHFKTSTELITDRVIDKNIVCFTDRSEALFKAAGFSNIHVIPHGIDTNSFRPPPEYRRRSVFRVLFTNAWGASDIKGYKHWEWLKKRFAGDNDIVLESTLGDTGHDTMPNFLSTGDATVFLSLWEETFGLVVTESMACGTPVISYPVGITPNVVRNEINGFVIPTSNPKDVEDAIRKMALMPEDQIVEMRRKAREEIAQNYTVERMAADYVSLAQTMR